MSDGVRASERAGGRESEAGEGGSLLATRHANSDAASKVTGFPSRHEIQPFIYIYILQVIQTSRVLPYATLH